MNDAETPNPPLPSAQRLDSAGATGAAASSRVSFERLRERTDELELLVSGLSMLALFSLPGWLLERYESSFTQLPLWAIAATLMALPMTIAICYLLGSGFLLHLGMRAYWVGLIGLRSAFPEGIRWSNTTGMGPINRGRLQARLPSIENAIERSDRLCSVLFSVITLSALTFLWLGLLFTVVFAAAGVLGSWMGSTNATITTTVGGFVFLLFGAPLALWLLDSVLASRLRRLREARAYRWVVGLLAGLVGILFPERLIAPVRLTLQTNTRRPRLLLLAFVLSIIAVPWFGFQAFRSSVAFDSFGTLRYVRAQDVTHGLRSRNYESLRINHDRMTSAPVIPSPLVEQAWVPLFLPYMPIRDDLLIEQRCKQRAEQLRADALAQQQDLDPEPALEQQVRLADATRACLATLWQVTLNGHPVSMDTTWASERRDLGARGLTVFIDLRGEQPGPQVLEVTWRPQPEQDTRADDYMPEIWRSVIPFIWSPEWASEPAPLPSS